jgi:hypothetical protein
MMGRAGVVVMTAALFVVLSGCATAAGAQGTVPTDAQRRECERNGGYWVTSSGFCRIGA